MTSLTIIEEPFMKSRGLKARNPQIIQKVPALSIRKNSSIFFNILLKPVVRIGRRSIQPVAHTALSAIQGLSSRLKRFYLLLRRKASQQSQNDEQ
jgi:hypothetical protein